VSVLLHAQPAGCDSAEECRRLARAAIDSAQYERAHDFAWLAYQKGSRSDPQTMTLLARAQSLSGRGDDAYVMLRRLSEAGIVVDDVGSSDDFARVRQHAGWPALLTTFERLAGGAREPVGEAATDASPPSASPAKPVPAANAPLLAAGRAPVPAPARTPIKPAVPAIADAEPFAPTPAEATRAHDDLTLPALPFAPAAMAYDQVSARFVLSASASDALTVLSQTSTNATSFTSRGWSGHERTTALAIDRRAGDLWVAVSSDTGAALHRLQLISGRRLDVIDVPGDSAEIVAITVTSDGLLALDRGGRQVLRRGPQSKSLSAFVTLAADIAPQGLTRSPRALYVAHRDGLLHIDGSSRRVVAVAGPDPAALAALHSLAWHDGVLLAIQHTGDTRQVLRLHLNGTGTRVTRSEALGSAASDVATLSGGVYHYLSDDADGVRVVRSVIAK
jgi:hypothetical protein